MRSTLVSKVTAPVAPVEVISTMPVALPAQRVEYGVASIVNCAVMGKTKSRAAAVRKVFIMVDKMVNEIYGILLACDAKRSQKVKCNSYNNNLMTIYVLENIDFPL